MSHDCLCVFGEVLYDHFPDGRRVLGGAPFNVAWHLQAFGRAPCFISRVGQDAEGEEIRGAMENWGMSTAHLQTDAQLPTGRVGVTFEAGEPHYDIVAPCAYDAIDTAPTMACRVLYHGSLALREVGSRRSLQRLRDQGAGMIFMDVNLRPPWWDKGRLRDWLLEADWVKLNQAELDLLQPGDGPDQARRLLQDYALHGVIVTRGEAGAMALTVDGECHEVAPAAATRVVDTVGAGDAFAAVTLLGLDAGWPLDLTLQRAQSFASALVGHRGATVNDAAFYRVFMQDWKLDS